ncbi:hypothetical protein HELRODRAFT_185324 [Helobdella robusta]|uniref:CBF1-interacting co-repressor CIR N-terminal domain-containing protein n=1 Tax=Helobdella robusta TaxID=6412 RepID=T1FMN9_HELRO|nr:hypothetical protein HELRODRAFT_185324 [Helobdella robusta]ESO10247.1 hypothetical protein HELRODRAFT_185324 [Helobdella robusta]
MNILPKKSWHVRNKKNIERVRRDEEKAANDEKEKQRRIGLAESESRSRMLKHLASKRQETFVDEECNNNKHVNFFENLETGEKLPRKNKQHEEEQKYEKEKQEKSLGILSYLGQGSFELEDKRPWYCDPHRKIQSTGELEAKKKKHLDPLVSIKKYKECTRKIEQKVSTSDKTHQKYPAKSITKSGSKSYEQLRAERISRENLERSRQQQLSCKNTPETICDERQMPYNSQFNPELTRRR